MPRSMTAFASVEGATDLGLLSLEIRSVNHRFLELGLRMPEELRPLESALRQAIGKRVSRGKTDFSVRIRSAGVSRRGEVDEQAADALAKVIAQLAERFPQLAPGSLTELLSQPDLMARAEVDLELLQGQLLALLEQLLDAFEAARRREGDRLAALMLERVTGLEEQRRLAIEQLPEIRQGLRDKLAQRIADLDVQVDPTRMEQELALLLTRSDVDEELDRLGIHLAEVRRVLGLSEPVGRRLDFLLQELLREVNTFGSKSVAAGSTSLAVEMKVLVEQIREQLQNLE